MIYVLMSATIGLLLVCRTAAAERLVPARLVAIPATSRDDRVPVRRSRVR